MSTSPILKVISENESLRQQLQAAQAEIEHFSKQNLEWSKCTATWQARAEKAEAALTSLKAMGEGWIPCAEIHLADKISHIFLARGIAKMGDSTALEEIQKLVREFMREKMSAQPIPAPPAEGTAAKEGK